MSRTENTDAAHVLSNDGFEKVRVLFHSLLESADIKAHVDTLAQAVRCFVGRDFFGLVGHLNTVEWDGDRRALFYSLARITLTDIGLADLGIPIDTRVATEAINLFSNVDAAAMCAVCGSEDTNFEGGDDVYDEATQKHAVHRTYKCCDCKCRTNYVFHLAEVKVEDGSS